MTLKKKILQNLTVTYYFHNNNDNIFLHYENFDKDSKRSLPSLKDNCKVSLNVCK